MSRSRSTKFFIQAPGQGWRDQDDADALRDDAVFRIAVDATRRVGVDDPRRGGEEEKSQSGGAGRPRVSADVVAGGVRPGESLGAAAQRVQATGAGENSPLEPALGVYFALKRAGDERPERPLPRARP